jgi:hypothetical protein
MITEIHILGLIVLLLSIVVTIYTYHYHFKMVRSTLTGKVVYLTLSEYNLCVKSGYVFNEAGDSNINLCEVIILRNNLLDFFISKNYCVSLNRDYGNVLRKLRFLIS